MNYQNLAYFALARLANVINSLKSFDFNWLWRFLGRRDRSKSKKYQIHDFRKFEPGEDYNFTLIDDTQAYINGQQEGLKVGDYLILPDGLNSMRYRVEDFDYYVIPSDTWVALVRKVESNNIQPTKIAISFKKLFIKRKKR